ncbi:MAG TPA: pitrilysin family protein [Polyangiaceae bacterium]|nr:pitrilysin family protein [Polyangiaceae bacterium]
MPSTTPAAPRRPRPSAPSPRAALVERLNAGREGGARLAYEGARAFGPVHAVETFRLGNGLRVLVLVDPSAPVVSYHTWFAVGSRHERPGKTGLAHFFEHLMFNETANLPAGDFDRRLEEAGAESNAATWVDWTYYYENVPRDRLPLVITMEADRMANLVLRQPQVDSEREVVANERRLRVEDDVDGSVNELLYKHVFGRHGYGWPTIGWMQDIEAYTPDDCAAFYRTYYAPNNATLVLVGDVKLDATLRRIQDAYGPLPAAALPVEDVQPEPPQTAERRLEVTKPTATERIAVGYRGPALGDVDHAALTVVNEALFGGRSSRAHRALVHEAELATDVRGWVGTFRDPGLYEMTVAGRPGVKAEALLEALDRVVEGALREPLAEEELVRVLARLELGALQGLETSGGKAEQIGFWSTVTGDPAGSFGRIEAIARVTRSDALRAARRYLTPSSRTAVLVRAGATSSGAAAAGEGGEAANAGEGAPAAGGPGEGGEAAKGGAS